MTRQVLQVQGVKQGRALPKAPQTVRQKARTLLVVILIRGHSPLDIHEASASHPTAITTGASVNYHGYPGTLRVILFPQAWKADLVGGIVKNGAAYCSTMDALFIFLPGCFVLLRIFFHSLFFHYSVIST